MAVLLESDPVCFKRDANGDLKFPLEYATGLEAVAIGIRTRILTCRGEWFSNLDIGIPLLPTADGVVTEDQAILGGRFDAIKIRAAYLREILSTPGVIDVPIMRMTFDGKTRVLTLTWVAQTRFGETPIDTIAVNIP